MKRILYYLIGIVVMLSSCNSEKNCIKLLQDANDNIYHFVSTSDTLLLLKAKEQLDDIKCSSLKLKVFYPKIRVFLYLKEYLEAIKYIKTINTLDFRKAYEKNMYLKTFQAMYYETQGNTIKRDELYLEIIDEIQSYANKSRDTEDLMYLLTMKQRIFTTEEILEEINFLKSTNLYDSDLLDSMKDMIIDMGEEILWW